MSLRKLTISFGNTLVLIDFSTSLNDFNYRDIIEMAYIFSVICYFRKRAVHFLRFLHFWDLLYSYFVFLRFSREN